MRTNIQKTYKLFIGGKFPRTESGRYFQVVNPATKKPIANVCQASRKDLREAVKAARSAFAGWSSATAYNRGQILYRLAEILEKRKAEFVEEICAMTKPSEKNSALKEVDCAIDRLVWYAGWSDKYQQIFGNTNPVAAPYFNFTQPEPTGVVGIVCPDDLALLPLISTVAPAIVSGNTVVVIASEKFPLPAITFGEVCETSDVPGGVVNILTGFSKELLPHLAKHMDVNAIDYIGTDVETRKMLQIEGSANVKRLILSHTPTGKTPVGRAWLDNAKGQSPYWIQDFVEMKTTWHPVGV